MTTRHSILRCGYLLPRVLLLWMVIDMGLHFAPTAWYTYRVHEFAAATGVHNIGPFPVNYSYTNSQTYGDLASMGNCRNCRQYRTSKIHSDELGFVNEKQASPYDAILVGDSFGIGAEQPQDSTLSARISQGSNLSIYNACWPGHTIGRKLILKLVDEVGKTNGIIFFELMDRSLEYPTILDDEAPEGFLNRLQREEPHFKWLSALAQDIQESPLANLSTELLGSIYDGRFLPNPYEDRIVRKSLPDGKQILFYPDDTQDSSPEAPKFWAKYLFSLNGDLRQRNWALVVILVPSKYTVYQPLIQNARPTNKSRLLEELQLALTDILVVNTVPAMQKEAADALAQGKLLYWSDDTHWNANGVRVAAIEVRKLLAASGKNSAALKLRRVSVVHSQ
jgi:hypothetical protein